MFYGSSVLLAGTLTRPADTNAYAAGDGITTATSAAAAMTIANAARHAGLGGFLLGGRLSKTNTVVTAASFRGWIYQSAPTAIPNDNAAFSPLVHADYLALVGTFTCDMSAVGIVGSDGVVGPITLERTSMAYKIASGTSLTVILEARGVYTPTSAEIFRLVFDAAQD